MTENLTRHDNNIRKSLAAFRWLRGRAYTARGAVLTLAAGAVVSSVLTGAEVIVVRVPSVDVSDTLVPASSLAST